MCGEKEERLCEESKKNMHYQAPSEAASLRGGAEEGPAVRIQCFLHQ